MRTISALTLCIVLLSPSMSHAVVFWDDEMEACTVGQFCYQPHFDSGTYAYDSTTKFSGSKSLRANLPIECDISSQQQAQCGGGMERSVPPTTDLYWRVHIRKSGNTAFGATIQTPTGFFISGFSATKVTRFVGEVDPEDGQAKGWINIGDARAQRVRLSMENNPAVGRAHDIDSGFALADNQWYCIEGHLVMNTNGAANGIAQVWIDGVLRINSSTEIFRRASGDNRPWTSLGVMRQNGMGNLWWDRFAAGNTRIGCVGTLPPVDTTRPTPPTNLTAQ